MRTFVIALVTVALLAASAIGVAAQDEKPASPSHLHPIHATQVGGTLGFTVDPGQERSVLEVPADSTFVLTDVLVYPLVEQSVADFVVRFRIEQDAIAKFQYNTIGTDTNWSQHFTAGIVFESGTTVTVVNTDFSTGRTGFQLLGYFSPSPGDGTTLVAGEATAVAGSTLIDLTAVATDSGASVRYSTDASEFTVTVECLSVAPDGSFAVMAGPATAQAGEFGDDWVQVEILDGSKDGNDRVRTHFLSAEEGSLCEATGEYPAEVLEGDSIIRTR